jgi:hypothetical protein
MLSANVGFLAIPGVVISTLNNTITSPSQVVIFASPAQIASYMSMEASVGSIVVGLLLVRHNRSKQWEDPTGAVSEQQRLVRAPNSSHRGSRNTSANILTADTVWNRWPLSSVSPGHC